MTTNYRKSTIPARQYEQTVKNIPEAETATNRALTTTPEQRVVTQEPELDYNTQIARQKAQIKADEARRQAISGVLDQYSTTRLNDHINGLPESINSMLELGLTDRADIDNYASKMTGSNSELSKVIRKSLQDAEPVTATLGFDMDSVYKASGASGSKSLKDKIKTYTDSTVDKYRSDGGMMNRNDMYDLGKEFESRGYDLLQRYERLHNNSDLVEGSAYKMMSESILNKATDGVDVSSKIDVNKLKSILPGNEVHAKRIDDLAANAKTVQDIRSAMKDATRLSLLKQAEERNINTYGQNVGDTGKNVNKAIKAIKAANSYNPLIALTQAGAEMIGDTKLAKQRNIKKNFEKAQKLQAQANGETPITTGKLAGIKEKVANIKDAGIVQGAKNIAGKAGEKLNNATANLNNETLSNIGLNDGLTLGTYLTNQANRQIGYGQARDAQERMANAQALSQAQSDYDNALADYQAQEATYNNQMAQLQSQNANSQLDRIANAMEMALNAGDITAYGQLADLYQQAAKIQELRNPTAADTKALTASQSKALTAQQQLDELAGMKPNAGSVAAKIPGISKLVDLAGGNEYESQADALATTLGYLLSGANIKKEELDSIYKDYVPTAFDSEAVRQRKLNNARQLIQSYMSDTGALAA
jgi:hypothetical protein